MESSTTSLKPILQQEPDRLPGAGCPTEPLLGASPRPAEPATDAIRAVRRHPRPRATTALIAHLLSELARAPDLMRQTGVSRQRVDQILKQLAQDGIIRRLPEPGTNRRYLWLRADVDAAESLRCYRKPLLRSCARILSCLATASLHSVPQVAQHLDVPYWNVELGARKLAQMGLVTPLHIGRRRLLSITPSGLAHPERELAVGKAPTVDIVSSLSPRHTDFIEALAVLGQARTIDLSAALLTEGQAPERNVSGPIVLALLRNDLVEQIVDVPGKHGRYRLTDTGRQTAAWIATRRPPPARDQLEVRIAAYQASRRALAQELLARRGFASRPVGAQSKAQERILQALELRPLATHELRLQIAGAFRHPRSIHIALKTLEQRGAIQLAERRNRFKVWALQDAARRQDSAAPVSP